jgi:hypothetical protein
MIGFTVRSAFWLSLVLLAIPFGGTTEDGRSIGPFEALGAARIAISDVVGICDRQPGVCETGKAAIQTIGVRARDASKFAFQVLDSHIDNTDPTATGTVRPDMGVDESAEDEATAD